MTDADARPELGFRPIYSYEEMVQEGRRMAAFWQARGIHVDWRIEMHQKQWTIRSSLTGREPCEFIHVQPPRRQGAAA